VQNDGRPSSRRAGLVAEGPRDRAVARGPGVVVEVQAAAVRGEERAEPELPQREVLLLHALEPRAADLRVRARQEAHGVRPVGGDDEVRAERRALRLRADGRGRDLRHALRVVRGPRGGAACVYTRACCYSSLKYLVTMGILHIKEIGEGQ
jgi:hypothetical protein